MKKHFNKELVMTQKDNGYFENSTKCWICDDDYIDTIGKVRDHFRIRKYSAFALKDCNINVKFNHKIPFVFHNLKNYHSHLIMQELGKFNLTIHVVSNELEKYMVFSINNKLNFIDNFQFLSSSLGNLGKNLAKDDFQYSSQELSNNVFDLVKQK